MFWIGVTIVAVVLFCVGVSLIRSSSQSTSTEDQEMMKGVGAILALIALVAWFIWTAVYSFHSVAYNHALVVQQFGSIVGRTGDGLVATAPWQDITEESTRVQRQDYQFNNVPSKENQSLTANVAINYHITPDKVTELVHDYGPNWYQNLVDPFVQQTVDSVAGTFAATDAHNHPNQVSQKIKIALQRELSSKAHGSDVDIVAVNSHFTLPPQMVAAILRKQVAVQNAATEKENVQVATNKAQQILVTAEKQAAANRALALKLTPLYVQYLAYKTLNPNVQVIYVPQGSTNLFSVPGGTK